MLRSGLVSRGDLPEIVRPEGYVESERYFSWEQYFSELLVNISGKNAYGKYSKEKLNSFYRADSSVEKILENVRGLKFRQ